MCCFCYVLVVFAFFYIVFMCFRCTVRINVIGVACRFHSVNNLSSRTITVTLAAAAANDHNNNNNSVITKTTTIVIPVVIGATGTISKSFR